MPINDLAGAIGSSLLTGQNQPGLASPIFSYPSANGPGNGVTAARPVAAAAPAPVVQTGPTAAQITAANNARTAAAINAGFDQVLGNYDEQLGEIPGQIADAGALVNNQADSQNKSIESAYGVGNSNLQFARDQLATNTGRSIQKLSQAIRSSFDSYNTLIGAAGGGDSSANGQLSYALQKAEAQNRTDIYNNEGDQNGAITQQQTGLDASHADQLQQLNTWKSNQIISIGQQFKAEQASIEAAKAGASKDKLLALASANSDLVNQAISALSGVTAQHQAATAAITGAVKSLQAPGNAPALSATTYTPTAGPGVATPSYTSANAGTTAGADSFSTVPYYKKLVAA